jgi:hypothetical protein
MTLSTFTRITASNNASFGREVEVDGAFGRARTLGDLLHLRGAEPALHEHGAGGLDDLIRPRLLSTFLDRAAIAQKPIAS